METRQLGTPISQRRCGGLFIAAGVEELIIPSGLSDPTIAVRAAWRAWGSPANTRVFYLARCIRDEPPAPGRLREFTQIGVELFGEGDAEVLLARVLDETGVRYAITREPRTASYYVGDGFTARSGELAIGAGGRYAEGSGWAIGLERLLVAVHGRSETEMI